MRFRALLVAPFVWVALFVAGDALFYGTPSYRPFLRSEIELAKVLSLTGSLAAALMFHRGDYLRRAWFLISACMALLLLRDLTIVPAIAGVIGPQRLTLVSGLLVVAANLAQIAGTWLLARAWKVANLSLPGSKPGQWALVVGAVSLALVLAGPVVLSTGRRVLSGDWTGLGSLASALGDLVSLCLVAPLLLTALALRGGLIGWPWALLTTSYVCWLVYDALGVLTQPLGLGPHATIVANEGFRALGCLFGFSAGMAQREVVARMRRLT